MYLLICVVGDQIHQMLMLFVSGTLRLNIHPNGHITKEKKVQVYKYVFQNLIKPELDTVKYPTTGMAKGTTKYQLWKDK